MSRRGKYKPKPTANPRPEAPRASLAGTNWQRSGWKLWRLRLLVLVAVPIFVFALVELSLRVGGFGYPTSFLLANSHNGEPTLVQNNQFGWRFFGPQMSRLPQPISLSQTKSPGTVRIFIFGESAAYGDPQPRFGLSRMLESLFSLRHPSVKFEVVNAAMTGINSHTVLSIARDCARANGDIWVIYMGNNEVIGPFGAGTVFGRQVPPLPIIRTSLALKTTRTGQLVDSARQWAQKPPPGRSEWGGMLMFLDQQVRAADPRMNTVYGHFESNLADILRAGLKSGAGIVVSTVAVNLKDCAPFMSAHRPGLSDDDKRQWEQRFNRGVENQRVNQLQEASEQFREAARIDNSFAELRFRQGQCALALQHVAEAQWEFTAARDLDTLRFRCDSRINELTRRAALDRDQERILLADAEHAFAEQSQDGLPGEELFYEHVHLTFEGNYLLARTIAAQAEKLLPSRIAISASPDKQWPSIADCARRLAWNRIESRTALSEILARVADPPFNAQINHDRQIEHLTARSRKLPPTNSPAEVIEALRTCEQASAVWPDDPFLRQELASLRKSTGDLPGAAAAIRRSLELLPTSAEAWALWGLILAQQQKFDEAAAAFKREFGLDSQDVPALQNLAMCLVKENRREEAIREYRRALKIKPRFGPAWLGLGQALETSGRKEEAMDCYRQALANRIHHAPDLATLARFCYTRGWYEAAVTNYSEALKLDPSDATLNFEAGQSLGSLGRHSEAAKRYEAAAALSPGWAQAQFQWGVELGQSGQPQDASVRFKEAVRLMPELLEARLNLGIALMNQKRYPEALEEFEQVIQRSPTNALATQYIQALRQKVADKPGD